MELSSLDRLTTVTLLYRRSERSDYLKLEHCPELSEDRMLKGNLRQSKGKLTVKLLFYNMLIYSLIFFIEKVMGIYLDSNIKYN